MRILRYISLVKWQVISSSKQPDLLFLLFCFSLVCDEKPPVLHIANSDRHTSIPSGNSLVSPRNSALTTCRRTVQTFAADC